MNKRATRIPGDAPAPAVVPEPVDDGLPNSVDVDPAAIAAPTLTKQGWVLPLAQPRAFFKQI
jgi:hypothetical protein